jgi:hypothetical protein
MFLFDASPLSMHGSSSSFMNRKGGSMPRERFLKGNPEKDKLGREKLNKFHNRKHTDYQLGLLQNRIRKLAQEEKNAQRKIQETQRRAESFLQTRYKFEVDQSIKNEYRLQQQKELELKRERLRQERLNSYEKKKQIRMNVIGNNLQDGMRVKQLLQNGFRDRDMRLDVELKSKLDMINMVKDHHKRHTLSKLEREDLQNTMNRSRFDTLMKKEEKQANSNISKMKQLERQEEQIMERLQNTLTVQQQAVKSLVDMVIANKRKQQLQQEPSSRSINQLDEQ